MEEPKKKKTKPEIKRRTPGLVITPPAPRLIESDHPALMIFQTQAEQQEITAVPQYRSTAVENTEQSPVNPINQTVTSSIEDSAKNENTAVLEYRSTAVPQLSSVPAQPPKERFYRKPNETSDAIDRHLTGAESKVYDQLLRLSFGFNQNWCQVTVTSLMQRSGYRSDKTIRDAIAGLIDKNLIVRLSHHNSPKGDTYQMLDASAKLPEYRSTAVLESKTTAVLESFSTGHVNTWKNKNDDERAAFGEELLTAAEQITGKATSEKELAKWREVATLLAEELISAAGDTDKVTSAPSFLLAHLKRKLAKVKTPDKLTVEKPQEPAVDISNCPDCAGKGFYYPNGFDAGVVICKHQKLRDDRDN